MDGAAKPTRKWRWNTCLMDWGLVKGGICKTRSAYYKRSMPHLMSSKITITFKDGRVEEFAICSGCGGRKKKK